MTEQERQLLNNLLAQYCSVKRKEETGFLQETRFLASRLSLTEKYCLLANLVATPAGQKDFEADDLIRRALARKPEATYLLVQRTLLQDIALKNAQSRINALSQQLSQAQPISDSRSSGGGNFLGGGWNQSPPPSQGWNVQQPAPPISAPQPNANSCFLRSAATTAAGVAGGALLFQGLENLFDHHGGWKSQPREIVENNFIEQPPVMGNDYGDSPQDNFLPDDYQADLGTDGGFDDNGTFYQG